ncbi:hypothetical protein CEXT_670711 [Caerostris extrusa]|uniref:Uncharacterized protein n=1 Tax=Caerostris extrusa TaxID=172846 RepID=A0AAV4U797_CAEEX|nr:hypothetical protein CEXT_670711 [Caerostris extrusa]
MKAVRGRVEKTFNDWRLNYLIKQGSFISLSFFFYFILFFSLEETELRVGEASFLTLVSIQSDESTNFPDVDWKDGVEPGKTEGGTSKKENDRW